MPEKVPSISELRKICQKAPQFETVAYARYFIRKISIYITWILVHFPITANQVTVAQAVFGIAGSVLLAFGGRDWAILALALIQFGYILDCVDGEVARYYKSPSVKGVFLDYLNHVIVIPFIFWGVVIYAYYITSNSYLLFLGIVVTFLVNNPIKKAQITTIFHFIERKENPSYNLNELKKSSDREIGIDQINKNNRWVRWAQAIADYPGSMNIISIAVLTDLVFKNNALFPVLIIYFYTLFLLFREIYLLSISIKTNRIKKDFSDIANFNTEFKKKE